jgi:hypothetical protein
MADVVSLHSADQPPTRKEREIYQHAQTTVPKAADHSWAVDDFLAEMVTLGVPTLERAEEIWLAYQLPGGPPPIGSSNKPTLAYLIGTYLGKLTPPELMAKIRKYFPGISFDEVLAEVDRHVARLNHEAETANRIANILGAWAERERANGRPENELTWGNCAAALGLAVPSGGYDLCRLKIADRKMVDEYRARTGRGAAAD